MIIQQPINEFLLWNNCNNHCKFCHQKANKTKYPGKFPDDKGKLKSIQLVKSFIEDGKVANGSHFLFMGGELFDTELSTETESAFLNLAAMVANRMIANLTGLLYLNTNLIYSDTSLLYKFLRTFTDKGLDNRLRLTTSYDIDYRYKNLQDKQTVEHNMQKISKDFPNVARVANCILTDKACEFLYSNLDFLSAFKQKYGFELNLIPYITLHQYMAPQRKDLLSLFVKLNTVYPGFIERYTDNLAVNQERILWEFNGNELIYASSKNADCGHNENFRRVYANDDRCFICDCNQLFNNM